MPPSRWACSSAASVPEAIGISGTFWTFVVASVAVAVHFARVRVAETDPRFRREG
jgi:hypothetical protein